jgi:MoxR-like ATPase|tara:strand:- start:269 stop:1222 length:954 start_codon:yes stop_codon:yes gene_type:complete
VQQDINRLKEWLTSKIVGQEHLVERLMIALLADGHLLVEGAPGLAKTKAIKTLSEGMEADFHRVQFTPDLLPADITGSDIYRPQKGTFEFQAGPLFHNLVLADEINRAPAKVQSALLEAMAERQISVGKNTYPLPELFLVMATQNPIEQEGTYPLPEAQMDRFLMHVLVDYPAPEAERAILALSRQEALNEPTTKVEPLTQKSLFDARKQVNEIHMSEAVEEYLVQLILATRNSTAYSGELGQWLDYGASPRATIALDKCSRALAWMEGRDFVTPDDIRAVAHDVLRHRLILSFEAEAGGINANQVIDKLLETVPSA